MTPLVKGIILGFSIAAPVGPIGLLCIRTTLNKGRVTGFLSGLGAATADAMYGGVAALGLTVVTRFLVDWSVWIQLAGAVFLLYLSYRTVTAPVGQDGTAESVGQVRGRSFFGSYLTTLFLTLTNPMTILSFVGIFAGMNISANTGSSAWLVAGLFAGSAFWWLLLAFVVGLLRKMVSSRVIRWLNYFSGAVLFGFAVWSIYQGVCSL